MIFGAAAALAVALVGAPPSQRWIAANRRSIAQTRDPKRRRERERIFDATVRELDRDRAAPATHDAPGAPLVVREILANGRVYRFGSAQKAPPVTWWDQLTHWASERWRAIAAALFKNVRLSGKASVALGDLLLGLAISAFLFLLARLVWQYARPSVRRSSTGADGTPLDAEELFAGAERAAQSGRYAQSVTAIFAAAVCVLQRRGLLREDPSETVGELRRRVRRPEFDVMARAVTQAVYADAAIGADDWKRAREAYLVLTRQTDARDAA